ncbi:hypothetical protein PC128_g26202, partial [Phytophthora cactorum]
RPSSKQHNIETSIKSRQY